MWVQAVARTVLTPGSLLVALLLTFVSIPFHPFIIMEQTQFRQGLNLRHITEALF